MMEKPSKLRIFLSCIPIAAILIVLFDFLFLKEDFGAYLAFPTFLFQLPFKLELPRIIYVILRGSITWGLLLPASFLLTSKRWRIASIVIVVVFLADVIGLVYVFCTNSAIMPINPYTITALCVEVLIVLSQILNLALNPKSSRKTKMQ